MGDIIRLLPDSVANQIAAGEVIQRPASVVKELMENAIDAGSTVINLVVKDAGKSLIQVVDNGRGMSETDARMCFERHATSKIQKSDDLFHIVSKGFRGEALASIAAIAQVEMKTRPQGAQLGTAIQIEGSKIKSQEVVHCAEGTSFSVKNLFYNVPARRYFLKSDAIELRHIIDEFHRVGLTHPEIEFSFTHNGAEVFTLPSVALRQRIVHTLGNRYNEKLVPVDETTDIVIVSGFVGKPDAAKKTRGEQYFFVNHRFIRNSYLHHAVMSAFEQLLPSGHFPLYLIYLTIDPAQIDINIHPTKTEIKFQDERAVYAIIHAAVRRALGKFNISPSLDFEQETSIAIPIARTGQIITQPIVQINHNFNPFGDSPAPRERDTSLKGWFDQREKQASGWQELLEIGKREGTSHVETFAEKITSDDQLIAPFEWTDEAPVSQLHRKYLSLVTPKGLMLIDQQRAHQRILFETYMRQLDAGKGPSQQMLFPDTVTLSIADCALIESRMEELKALGFDLIRSSEDTFEIVGMPADAAVKDGQKLLEEFIEQWKNERGDLQYSPREKMAWALAAASSIRYGQMLTTPEMNNLVHQLFQCAMPYNGRENKATIIQLSISQLEQQFR